MGWLLMMLLEQDVALMKLPHLSVLSVDLAIYTPASVWRWSLPKWPKIGRTCWSSMHCALASRTSTCSQIDQRRSPVVARQRPQCEIRDLQKISRLMRGEKSIIRGGKTINLPFACQQIPCLHRAIETPHGELLFMELHSIHQTICDNKISFCRLCYWGL